MSTLVDFVPSTIAAFQFQAQLNGTPYNVTVTWNLFGQRFYINVNDLSGNLILCRALTSSGPSLLASLTWLNGTATATTPPHNVPVGSVAAVTISQTNSGFDGSFPTLSTGATTLTYSLLADPGVEPVAGVVNFSLNLVDGYGIGTLLYHDDTMQFEF